MRRCVACSRVAAAVATPNSNVARPCKPSCGRRSVALRPGPLYSHAQVRSGDDVHRQLLLLLPRQQSVSHASACMHSRTGLAQRPMPSRRSHGLSLRMTDTELSSSSARLVRLGGAQACQGSSMASLRAAGKPACPCACRCCSPSRAQTSSPCRWRPRRCRTRSGPRSARRTQSPKCLRQASGRPGGGRGRRKAGYWAPRPAPPRGPRP